MAYRGTPLDDLGFAEIEECTNPSAPLQVGMRDNPQLALKLWQRRRQTSYAGRSLANVAWQQRQADLIGNGLGDSQQRVHLVNDPAFVYAMIVQPFCGPRECRIVGKCHPRVPHRISQTIEALSVEAVCTEDGPSDRADTSSNEGARFLIGRSNGHVSVAFRQIEQRVGHY